MTILVWPVELCRHELQGRGTLSEFQELVEVCAQVQEESELPNKDRGNSRDSLHVEGKPRKNLVPHKNVAGIRMVNPTNP